LNNPEPGKPTTPPPIKIATAAAPIQNQIAPFIVILAFSTEKFHAE
jgi:hypothetical protein